MNAGSIVLIVNLIFLGLLVLGFLTGLRRGLKRSALHLCFVAVAILIAYFTTRPIVNFVLNLNIVSSSEGTKSIGEFLASMMGDVSKYSPTLGSFITQLPAALVSPIIFMLVLLVVQFFMWIIFMIVARICFKTKKYEKANGIKRHRLWGSLIGTIDALVFAIFLFMPLTSLTHTFGELAVASTNPEIQTTGNLIREYVPGSALDIIDGYNSSPMGVVVHLWGFDHVTFNGLSYVTVNNEKIMWRDEVTLLANIYNKTVEILNKDGSLASEDYEKLAELANELLDGKLLTNVISPTITEVIENFDKVLEDAKIGDEIREKVEVVVSNLETRLESGTTLISYIKENVKVLTDIVNELSKNGALDTITNAEKFSDVLTYDTLSKIVPQISKIVDMTLVEDVYSVVSDTLVEALASLDEYVDVESFKDFNVFKSDVKKVLEIIQDMSNVKASETSSTNMLQDIVNGKNIDVVAFVNSDAAASILSKMTEINILEKGIVRIINLVDDQFIEIAKAVYTGKGEINYTFERTIPAESTPEQTKEFVAKIGLQAESFIQIARLALNSNFGSNLGDIGAVLDIMKDNIVSEENNFNEETLASDGVFATMFRNLYKILNGTVKDTEEIAIFEQYEQFNKLIEKRANGATGDLKYYKVNYTDLFADLQSALDVADAYSKHEKTISDILSGTSSASAEDLMNEFASIIEEVGVDEFVNAVELVVDVLDDFDFDLTDFGENAEDLINSAIESLQLSEEVTTETLQKLKNSLSKLFQSSEE